MSNQIDKLNYFMQKVVPQVYDGAASYYELVNKVIDKLNEVVASSNEYFAVDLTTYAEGVLQKWKDDGTLETLINETALADVNQKIEANTTQLAEKANQSDLNLANETLTNKANQTDLDSLSGRINNLVANAGDVSNNAELLDIRVDDEGTTYETAGDAVRSIGTRTQNLLDQLEDTFYIADNNGNVVLKVDKNGVVGVGLEATTNLLSLNDDAFYIADNNGNIIFKANKDGVTGLGLSGSTSTGSVSSPYTSKKLITIGDSLSTAGTWQNWLVEWLGVTFNLNESNNGDGIHQPMAVGGTPVDPTATGSIYIRSLDAHYYNPDVIIVYAGQNDVSYVGDQDAGTINTANLGTINDTPYTDRVVPVNRPTFYASYMGMIENLITDNPTSKIVLMCQMPARLAIGMVGTADPYNGIVRFPDQTACDNYEVPRQAVAQAIRDIANKYGLPLVDLWKDAGIDHLNASSMYGSVGGTCGQVHPNDLGYKRMAEVIYGKIG